MWSLLLTLSVATLIDDLFDRLPTRQLQAENRRGFDDLPVEVKRSVYHSLADEGLELQNSLPVTLSGTTYCNAAIAGAAAMRQPFSFLSKLKEVTVDSIDGKSVVNERVVHDPVDHMLFKQFKHEIRMYAREELSPQKIMNESLRPNLIPIRGGNVSVTLLDWKDVALSKGRLSTAMVAKTERREDSRKNFSHATYARRLSQLHPDFSRFYLTKAHPEAPSPEASAESFLDAEARWGNHDGMNANMNRKLIEYYQQWKELQRPHAAEAESPRELQSVALTRRGFTQIELTPPETGPRCRLLTQSTPSDDDEMEMLPPDSAPETFCMPSSVSSYDTAEEVFTGYYHVRPARWDILMWYRRKFFQFELMPTWARIPGLNGQNFLANDRASLTAYHVSLRPAGIAKDLYDWTASDDRDWNAPPLFNTVFLREDGYRVNEWAEGEAPYGPDMWGSSAFSNDGAVTSSDAAYKMLQHGGRSDSEYAARIQHRRTLLANGSEAATRRRLTLKVLPARNLTVPQRSLGSRLREWITQPSKPRVVL